MREILFRGKTRNGEWKFGTGLLYDSMHTWLVNNPLHKAIAFGEEHYQVIPETVGQYTGLTANGKKIFEGDIVRCKYANAPKNEHIQKVVFFGCKFMAEFSNGGCYSELYDGARHLTFDKSAYMTEIEIIGNIHDNPELLKGGD